MDLRDKNVIVSGGVSGIGKTLVKHLVNEGSIVGVLDINAEGLNDLIKDNKNIYGFECDVTNYKQIEKIVENFYQQFGEINVLINNAGILYNSPLVKFSPNGIEKHDIEMWNKVIATDLSSIFYLTSNVVEKMVMKRTKGVIANISSICAAGNPGQSAYSAAKAGVNALTVTWARELSLLGIRTIGIAPGYTDTESTQKIMNKDVLKEIVKKVPLRRLGKPDEIANGIIAVIKNDFFNGKIFELDGGLII